MTVAKTGGLGDGLLFGPYVMSGDVQSLGAISSPRGSVDLTGIDKKGMERGLTTKDASLAMTTFFNPGLAANSAHKVLSVLPRTDVQVAYLRGTLLGSAAFCLVSKQIDYNGNMNADKSFTFAVSAQANGYGGGWGEQLTAGVRTDAAPTSPATGVDLTDVSTLFGWQAYLFVTGVTGTSVTVQLQDSADNAAFTNLTGGAFTAATGLTTQRLESGRTDTVRRYVRAITTGTFTSASFAVVFVRNRAQALFG